MPKPEKLHSDTGTSVEGRPRHPRSHYCTVQWMYHCLYIDYRRSKGCLPRSFPRRSHHVPAHAVSAPFSHPTMMDSTTGALLCCCSITPILCATIHSSFLYFTFLSAFRYSTLSSSPSRPSQSWSSVTSSSLSVSYPRFSNTLVNFCTISSILGRLSGLLDQPACIVLRRVLGHHLAIAGRFPFRITLFFNACGLYS